MNGASSELGSLVRRAVDARSEFVSNLARESTDCWRVFHGSSEGRPGLTIDRYGELVLVQTFREPLADSEVDEIERTLGARIVWNHRGKSARQTFAEFAPDDEWSTREFVVREHGVRFPIRARHRGIDPWLFLDMRAGRRAIAAVCRGRSVLNLFAYTGSASITALVHGARSACNVDFARSSADVATRSEELNSLVPGQLETIIEDFFPVARQFAGLPVKGRASARPYVKLEKRSFDVILLDPPAFSRGAFGAVDVVRDYPSLVKPALLALSENGVLIATNHVAGVSREDWRETLERSAVKCGRSLASLEFVEPDADFQSFDGRPPLKIAVMRV
ncbi:MAG: class I SAM-dependent methyltransferase [Planctomycetota bacterium]|nr:class I SAM-dependent methyltransferase [Planctomycetota bacterium]